MVDTLNCTTREEAMRLAGITALIAAASTAGAAHGQEHSAEDIRRAIDAARAEAAAARARGERPGLGRARGANFGPARNVLVSVDGVNTGAPVIYTPTGAAAAPLAAGGRPDPAATTHWVFVEEFGEIQFQFDSAQLEPASVTTVAALGEALRGQTRAVGRILLVGHTDASGDETYNFALSVRRANALASILAAQFGVDPQLLASAGAGEWDLKTPQDPAGAQNRRVEVYLEAAD
jgi:outer membrane protein OmpA-like peptidoglycan-associated protein